MTIKTDDLEIGDIIHFQETETIGHSGNIVGKVCLILIEYTSHGERIITAIHPGQITGV